MQKPGNLPLKTSVSSTLSRLALLSAALLSLQVTPLFAQQAQQPAPAYGPYYAVFLADGPGLTKSLTAPSGLDPRAAQALERMGMNPGEGEHAALLAGRASWTLAFWFHSSDPLNGTELLAGIGNPAAEDARFIGLNNDHLALWLGTGSGRRELQAAQSSLAAREWHLAVATSDGRNVKLYADGTLVLETALTQGDVAGQLSLAPSAEAGVAQRHFVGKLAAVNVWGEALSAEQIKAMAAAPPDFALPTYEEASAHWPVQTRGMAGQVEPQDPSTLPHGKGPMLKPVAKPLPPAICTLQPIDTDLWRLRGGWQLTPAPEVKAAGSAISTLAFHPRGWLAATVPGTVLTTMVDRGIYPDPDYGLDNLAIPESLAHQDYWYRVAFKTPKQTSGQQFTLSFRGVNYAAEVWLNGNKLGGFTGAFLRGTFDVTGKLSATAENVLAVRVSPPPHAGIANEESIKGGPGENGGMEVLDGPTFSASEGWDWIPSIRDRNTGIWQDVTLSATGPVKIGDLNIITTLPKPDRSEADVEIEAPVTNASAQRVEGDLTANFDDVTVTRRVTLAPGQTVVRLKPAEFPQLKVQHPRLWWPNGYGAPTLHTLHIRFITGGRLSAEKQIQFGMREVSYETSLMDSTGHLRRVEVLPSRTYDSEQPLIDGSHEGIRQIDDRTPNLTPPVMADGRPIPPQFLEWMRHSWVQSLEPGAEDSPSIRPVEGGWPGTDLVIKVNGVRIAARGGNWGMDDSRKRVSTAHLEPYFRLHRDAHVNIIRNWMGQNTEENFYALADKYGLMVWNDFWESTEGYNLEAQDPALFLENARDTILRFRHHPSIIVWCGRNEGVPQPIINQGLAHLVRTLDHTRYYTGSSNQVNLRNSGPYQFEPLTAYYGINRGFSVELGIPSVPTLESLESFIPAADRWPISDTWAYHDWHQKGNGNVAPFMAHLDTEFGAPTGFEDFVRKAQMLDYVGHRAIFEGFAAHLWQPNSGRMIWMTQPAWPSTEWNFLSWDYDTQSSFYGAQKACEPIHAQMDLTNGNIDLINLGPARTFAVQTRVVALDGKVIHLLNDKVQAAADARTSVGKLDLDKEAQGHTIFVVMQVSDEDGKPVGSNFYWWAQKEATLRELDSLPKVRLKATAGATVAADKEREVTVKITNASAAPALMAKLTLQDSATGKRILPAYYSENYISLLPGEERTVTIEFPAGRGKPSIGLRGWNLQAEDIAVQ